MPAPWRKKGESPQGKDRVICAWSATQLLPLSLTKNAERGPNEKKKKKTPLPEKGRSGNTASPPSFLPQCKLNSPLAETIEMRRAITKKEKKKEKLHIFNNNNVLFMKDRDSASKVGKKRGISGSAHYRNSIFLCSLISFFPVHMEATRVCRAYSRRRKKKSRLTGREGGGSRQRFLHFVPYRKAVSGR